MPLPRSLATARTVAAARTIAAARTAASARTLGASTYSLAMFISDLQDIAQLRALWIPGAADTTTTTSTGPAPRVWTYDADISARISSQGSGVLVAFDGLANRAQTPDTADLSFGDASVDSPFSIAALASVTDTAAIRELIAKDAASGAIREWQFHVDSSDKLTFRLIDGSAAVSAFRISNSAITQGALHLFGGSYAGTGGATAANGVTLFQDGAVIASTATNNAAYVAMENSAATTVVGARQGFAEFMAGSMGAVAVWAANLATAQHLAAKVAFNNFYGLTL